MVTIDAEEVICIPATEVDYDEEDLETVLARLGFVETEQGVWESPDGSGN
ncbi:MAG: hypothetical protein AAFX78_01935 [Cyanobacteria bacterium J06638_20]